MKSVQRENIEISVMPRIVDSDKSETFILDS